MNWFEIWYMLKSICLIALIAWILAVCIARLFRHDDDEDDEA